MEIYDLIVTVFYLILVYAVAIVVRSFHRDNKFYQSFFLKGLTAKLIGGIAFALVYTYFYTYGGDTMAYYHDAELLTNYFFRDATGAVKFLLDPGSLVSQQRVTDIGVLNFGREGSEFPVVRMAAILNIFALNSYYSTTILFAGLSYFGIWHFYLVFAKRYPQIYQQLAWAIFFIPSVFFWGSGIMKDTIVIGFLGLVVYAIDRFLVGGIQRWKWLTLSVVCALVIFNIKAYVIMALAPALVVWVILSVKDRVRNKFLRSLIVPILLALTVVGVAVSIQVLGQFQAKYSIENITSTARSMQSWHYVEGENTSEQHGRGSSYTLGEYDPTLWGILKMFPASVNVTLFRPYVWEANNIAVLASALESLALFLFSIYIFLGLGIHRVLPLLIKDPFLMMGFSFAILFAFAVGFTSYNFGALARYKIPAVPFFVAALLILNDKVRGIKRELKERRSENIRKSSSAFAISPIHQEMKADRHFSA